MEAGTDIQQTVTHMHSVPQYTHLTGAQTTSSFLIHTHVTTPHITQVLRLGIVAAFKSADPPLDSSLVANYLWALATLHGADSVMSSEEQRGEREAMQGGLREVS